MDIAKLFAVIMIYAVLRNSGRALYKLGKEELKFSSLSSALMVLGHFLLFICAIYLIGARI